MSKYIVIGATICSVVLSILSIGIQLVYELLKEELGENKLLSAVIVMLFVAIIAFLVIYFVAAILHYCWRRKVRSACIEVKEHFFEPSQKLIENLQNLREELGLEKPKFQRKNAQGKYSGEGWKNLKIIYNQCRTTSKNLIAPERIERHFAEFEELVPINVLLVALRRGLGVCPSN